MDKIDDNIREYMKRNCKGGDFCPYCHTANVTQDGELTLDDQEIPFVYRTMKCVDCGRQWVDLFKLADILQEIPEKKGGLEPNGQISWRHPKENAGKTEENKS
jgi:hypothetical protein